MRDLRTTATVVLVTCGLCVLGCAHSRDLSSTTTADAQLTTEVPTGWVTIHGEGISVALPGTFVGGDSADPEVLASVRRDRGTDAFPQPPQGFEFPLIAWDQSESSGPWVVVMRAVKPPTTSMEELVTEYLGQADQFTVVSLSEDRAYVVENAPLVLMGGADHSLNVFIRDGWDFYLVMYACDDGSADVLDPVFMTSAETVSVQRQTD